MAARSFAFDSWVDRLLFYGVNFRLRDWLETHRCAPRSHTFLTRWQIGPEFTWVSYACQGCTQTQSINVRTPFDLFHEQASTYLRDGWPEMPTESLLWTWQSRHRSHILDTQALLQRSYGNGRVRFHLACPCGSASPTTEWVLEARDVSASASRPRPGGTEVGPSGPPQVSKMPGSDRHLIRHRQSGAVYQLPALMLTLTPVEDTPTVNCGVESLWTLFDRYYEDEDPRHAQTWHERLGRE